MNDFLDEEIVSCLKVCRWTAVSLKTKLKAFAEHGSFLAMSELSKSEWQKLGQRRLKTNIKLEDVNISLDKYWLRQANCHFIPKSSTKYPKLLHQLTDAPVGLFVMGDVELLNSAQIAIVGSRKQTPAGQKITTDFSSALSRLGITVTSGLALGIDASAHRACCLSGGNTVAVLGNGLDTIYPRQNQQLAQQILQQGCIVSELPIGTPPRPQNFPARNRIISGLSIGVVVIEAAKRSGSLITARLANEQGKDVFAVPGSALSPQSSGCHELIRQGAVLASNVNDILQELDLPLMQSMCDFEAEKNISNKTCPVLNKMGYDPILLEELFSRLDISFESLSQKLVELELEGFIERGHNGYYTRLN